MNRQTKKRTRRLLLTGLCCLGAISAFSGELRADGWMFRRSYYTHDVQPTSSAQGRGNAVAAAPVAALPSRFAYRRPYISNRPGFSARGGYRINRIFLQSGSSSDLTVLNEGWISFTP